MSKSLRVCDKIYKSYPHLMHSDKKLWFLHHSIGDCMHCRPNGLRLPATTVYSI